MPELRQALACLYEAESFDVISDHTSPIALSIAASGVVPVLHTVHGPLDGELGAVYNVAMRGRAARRAGRHLISSAWRATVAAMGRNVRECA